ncbi:ATPase component of general energizing module of ECF transporters [Geomicrobium sp. JCM 19037]|uniref:energy-coupling factor transporter ATPase n=1 Tax=Geomicrobium sp. JCM 19037 TaxID=1460634 RepID=UPI00045F1B98|nr:energy-coupling factor transporter ATPase [Geomicrobium sp. JCM 19037]GAK04759.1 ATPase component of general energizing module of ECF transporters [Geomicrobium sp. JCM 19037]
MQKTIIDCRDLYFTYEEEQDWILNNLSFQAYRGEWIAILGTNGSGKSTLARMLNALLIPTSGTTEVDGLRTDEEDHIWEIRQKAGMVFQNPDHQFVAATVRDDIAFGLENAGISREQMIERIQAASEQVAIDDHLDAEPHRLSGGQKQRAAIAGILALRPDIMIFDESTSMLDPEGRKEVMKTMNELHERGFTLIMITHDLQEAMQADRVVFMEKGTIVKDMSTEAFFQDPAFLMDRNFHLPYFLEVQAYLNDNKQQAYMLDEDEWVKMLCKLHSTT